MSAHVFPRHMAEHRGLERGAGFTRHYIECVLGVRAAQNMVDVHGRKRVHGTKRNLCFDLEGVQLGDGLRRLGRAALPNEHDGLEVLAACLLRDDGDLRGVERRFARELGPAEARGSCCSDFRRKVEDTRILRGNARGHAVPEQFLRCGGRTQGRAVCKRHPISNRLHG